MLQVLSFLVVSTCNGSIIAMYLASMAVDVVWLIKSLTRTC